MDIRKAIAMGKNDNTIWTHLINKKRYWLFPFIFAMVLVGAVVLYSLFSDYGHTLYPFF